MVASVAPFSLGSGTGGLQPLAGQHLRVLWSCLLAIVRRPAARAEGQGLRPGRVVRLASASGLLMTLLFVLRSAFPIIGVKSRLGYSAKIVAVLAGANALGLLVYRAGRARASGTLLAG